MEFVHYLNAHLSSFLPSLFLPYRMDSVASCLALCVPIYSSSDYELSYKLSNKEHKHRLGLHHSIRYVDVSVIDHGPTSTMVVTGDTVLC
jgi:hypothetical protein